MIGIYQMPHKKWRKRQSKIRDQRRSGSIGSKLCIINSLNIIRT
jgi:hypothetical protein